MRDRTLFRLVLVGSLLSVPGWARAKGIEVEVACDDGHDNDDGWTDCADADCLDVGPCGPTLPPQGRASYMFQQSPAIGDDGVADVPVLWANRSTAVVVRPNTTIRVYGALVSNVPNARAGGVVGWMSSIAVEGDVHPVAVTTEGTAAARPPVGRRSTGLSFDLTELVDPARNGGREGVVSAVIPVLGPESIGPYHAVGTATVLAIDLQVDDVEGPTGTLECHDGLVGNGQPVLNSFQVDGERFDFEVCFPMVFVPTSEISFKRGDANGDAAVNLTDAIVIFRFLYRGGPTPTCLKSADADDSGGLGITDVIFLLNSLFRSAALPPPPFRECGTDPTEDPLSCDLYSSCDT